MNKLNLFIYPHAIPPIQDLYDWYKNTVPFCSEGIKKWCSVKPTIEGAEFFLMGSVREFDDTPYSTFMFWFFKEHLARHIVDLEGDYRPGTFREEFNGSIRVATGAPHAWREQGNVFPRPAMSRMLVEMATAHSTAPAYPADRVSFGFIGKRDRQGVRAKIYEAAVLSGCSQYISLLDEWNGPSEPTSPVRVKFESNLLDNGIALCPQGEGVATARFYEACRFGRFPVIIGETMLLGEDQFDTSFCCQMEADLSVEVMATQLDSIASLSLAEVQERGRSAREYWEKVVVPYFRDPTLFFLEWMERKGLRP
jgi:hypothetical protein